MTPSYTFTYINSSLNEKLDVVDVDNFSILKNTVELPVYSQYTIVVFAFVTVENLKERHIQAPHRRHRHSMASCTWAPRGATL